MQPKPEAAAANGIPPPGSVAGVPPGMQAKPEAATAISDAPGGSLFPIGQQQPAAHPSGSAANAAAPLHPGISLSRSVSLGFCQLRVR